MAGVYVSALRQLIVRLNNGYTSLGLKSIQVMNKPERLQPDMTPYIQIVPSTDFISEDYGEAIKQRYKRGQMNVQLWVEYPVANRDYDNSAYEQGYVIDNANNHIVDNSGFLLAWGDYSGFLQWIEQLLDVINTDVSTNEANPQLVNANTSIGISVRDVIKHDMTIEATIDISINVGSFVINNRQGI